MLKMEKKRKVKTPAADTLNQGNEAFTNIKSDSLDNEFLLKEYEHLVEYQKVTVEGYDRWFNVYLTIGAAVVTVVIPLIQSFSSGNKTDIVNLILGGFFFFGTLNFIGLSYTNAVSIHYERAIRLIQDRFIMLNPDIEKSLYFRSNSLGVGGNRFGSMVIRGITNGSPKSTVVIINSLLLAFLLMKIGLERGIIHISLPLQLLAGFMLFMIIGIIHVFIGKIIYKVHGV